jgi:NNP family nitrate/nitrite transporter-like MFS transporter
LSSIPAWVLLSPVTPSYELLLLLGVFLGVGGASFAIALPMAGSSFPPRMQGLVLGLAAAGNIGAVLDGFLFPTLAQHIGWQRATCAVLPLLAISAAAILLWAEDRTPKSGSASRAFASFAASLAALAVLVLLVASGAFGPGKAAQMILPLLASLIAVALLPRAYLAVFTERDTWVVMLVYSITFGGFVGMSSYVSLFLTSQYQISKIDAGLVMALMTFTGAMVRPVGGWIADKLSGVRVLLVLLTAISIGNLTFAALMPALAGAIALLLALYVCFGLGNGATFQFVPHRWRGKGGLMTGIIGAAGGIGGFYLPVVMGTVKESTGGYQGGFLTFGILAAVASLLVLGLQHQWRAWAIPEQA